jgi:hypothetical protein
MTLTMSAASAFLAMVISMSPIDSYLDHSHWIFNCPAASLADDRGARPAVEPASVRFGNCRLKMSRPLAI